MNIITRKPDLSIYASNNGADQPTVTVVFPARIIQYLWFPYLKFQDPYLVGNPGKHVISLVEAYLVVVNLERIVTFHVVKGKRFFLHNLDVRYILFLFHVPVFATTLLFINTITAI